MRLRTISFQPPAASFHPLDGSRDTVRQSPWGGHSTNLHPTGLYPANLSHGRSAPLAEGFTSRFTGLNDRTQRTIYDIIQQTRMPADFFDLDALRGKRVLDLGCGHGMLTLQLRGLIPAESNLFEGRNALESLAKHTLTKPSPWRNTADVLRTAEPFNPQANIEAIGLAPDSSPFWQLLPNAFIQGRAQQLPQYVAPNSVDVIFSTFSVFTFAETFDIQNTLTAAAQVLKPGGVLRIGGRSDTQSKMQALLATHPQAKTLGLVESPRSLQMAKHPHWIELVKQSPDNPSAANDSTVRDSGMPRRSFLKGAFGQIAEKLGWLPSPVEIPLEVLKHFVRQDEFCNVFHGKIPWLKQDVVTFEAETMAEVASSARKSMAAYVDFCRDLAQETDFKRYFSLWEFARDLGVQDLTQVVELASLYAAHPRFFEQLGISKAMVDPFLKPLSPEQPQNSPPASPSAAEPTEQPPSETLASLESKVLYEQEPQDTPATAAKTPEAGHRRKSRRALLTGWFQPQQREVATHNASAPTVNPLTHSSSSGTPTIPDPATPETD
ncbi:MAG: methyltransferase domain-containing protein [Candidatus Melainabacteria bacterium]|nr:methyltransferase domain-containing protein [Candidatus Melainabacteria bacterium]